MASGPGGSALGLAVLCATALVVAGTLPAGATTGGSGPALPVADHGLDPPDDNRTAHEHPERVESGGDSRAVGSWLADRLAGRLNESAVHLDRGEYAAARAAVGDDYDRRLEQYIDVAGDTPSDRDDRLARELAAARESQREVANATADYRRTYREYRRARRNGNTSRARRLARELERDAERVNRTAADLERSLATVGNATNVSTEPARRSLEEERRNVSATQRDVRSALFVGTRLSARLDAEEIAFDDPATLRGRVTMANGTPVANRSIGLAVGERTLRTATDGDGRFAVRYRPVGIRTGTVGITVTLRPAAASAFLASNDSVAATVRSTPSALAVRTNASTVGFGDRLVVEGRVTAGERAVPGVPVTVTAGGVAVGVARTDEDGRFLLATALPRTVAPGMPSVEARIDLQGRAITRANATASLAVGSRATTLSVRAAGEDDGTLAVAGRLEAADGTPVGNATLRIAVDGEPVGTVRTGANGSYATTVPVDRAASGTVSVGVSYAGAANLEGSRAAATVAAVDADGPDGTDGDGVPVPAPWLGVGALLLVLVGGLAVGLRGGEGETGGGTDASDLPGVVADEGPDEPARLARAESALADDDYTAAIAAAYGAVRLVLGRRVAVDGPATHAAFQRACAEEAVLEADVQAALAELTAAYETAAFAPEAPGESAAREALAAAETVLEAAG